MTSKDTDSDEYPGEHSKKVGLTVSISTTFGSFKATVGRFEKKRAELSRNKKHDELEHLLLQPFCMQQECTSESSEETGIYKAEKALEKEKAKTEELTSRLSKLSVRNVNKRIKRRDMEVEKQFLCSRQ